jgi:hypothetical protein
MRKMNSRTTSSGRRRWLGPWGIALLAGLLLALGSLAGCGGKEETTTTVAPTTATTAVESTTTESTAPPEESTTTLFDIHSVTSSTEPVTSTTVTTEALSSAERRLPNGHIKAMGYITAVWESGGKRWITIDYAEMITDHDEATRRAREAGEIGPTEEWEYDYYISNVNPALRTFQVSNSVVITTSTRWVPGDDWEAPCTWTDFKSFWGPGPFPESEQWLHTRPWWIERDGPIVVRIDEQYLP